MALKLRKLGIHERDIVSGITMDPGQEGYAGGSIDQVFAGIESSPEGCHPFALLDAGTPVGFFVLREGASLASWVKKGCISLNNLRIDHQVQGQGHGKLALRLAAQWIRTNRPTVTHVMASVNVKNALAMRFNLASGFVPTGAIVEGRLGPQKVICVPIDRLANIQAGEKSSRSL
jgi:RimJ/RimL family protein N-acetyltransferase